MESSTDPAPFSMMETTIVLKPEDQWRKITRWYSWLPDILKGPFRRFWPDHISYEDLINEMEAALKIPGTTNAWTMPIKARIDMLSTGVRTPIGIKVLGSDLKKVEEIGTHLEMILKNISGTRSVFAERTAGGYFLDFDLKREELARYGLTIEDAQMTILTAIGGENISTTVEGRERYPVNVRYPREFRDDVENLTSSSPYPSGQHIPWYRLPILCYVRPGHDQKRTAFWLGTCMWTWLTEISVRTLRKQKNCGQRTQNAPRVCLIWSGQYENMLR